MMTPDRKVRKLMEEYQKTGNLSKAAFGSDLGPKTARKYLKSGKLPSKMRVEHTLICLCPDTPEKRRHNQ